jgi:hypothetical protein
MKLTLLYRHADVHAMMHDIHNDTQNACEWHAEVSARQSTMLCARRRQGFPFTAVSLPYAALVSESLSLTHHHLPISQCEVHLVGWGLHWGMGWVTETAVLLVKARESHYLVAEVKDVVAMKGVVRVMEHWGLGCCWVLG